VSGVLASGDVNGDGRVDALAIGQLAGTFTPGIWVAAHLNRGRGAFRPPIVSTGIEGQATGFGVSSVAIADVNHDGKLDIVGGVDFIFPQAAHLFVLLGNGDGSFGPATMYGTGDFHAATQSMAVGDVNGDGNLDIVGHTWAQHRHAPWKRRRDVRSAADIRHRRTGPAGHRDRRHHGRRRAGRRLCRGHGDAGLCREQGDGAQGAGERPVLDRPDDDHRIECPDR